jgi:hypothetical protein
VHFSQRLGQRAQPLFGLPHFLIRLGQQDKKMRPPKFRSHSLPGGQALAYLSNSLLSLSLLG